MLGLAEIQRFISGTTGIRESRIKPASDLERDLGVTGDDFFELTEAFAREFKVDMSNYRWYFHHGEEVSFNPGALFVRPPYCRVAHIAVTPNLLLSAAQAGRWPLTYPEHSLPGRRYDILLTHALFGLIGLVLLIFLAFT